MLIYVSKLHNVRRGQKMSKPKQVFKVENWTKIIRNFRIVGKLVLGGDLVKMTYPKYQCNQKTSSSDGSNNCNRTQPHAFLTTATAMRLWVWQPQPRLFFSTTANILRDVIIIIIIFLFHKTSLHIQKLLTQKEGTRF